MGLGLQIGGFITCDTPKKQAAKRPKTPAQVQAEKEPSRLTEEVAERGVPKPARCGASRESHRGIRSSIQGVECRV